MAESSNESASCEHVRLYSHNWQGAHLFTPCLICERDRLRAALERCQAIIALDSIEYDEARSMEAVIREALAGSPQQSETGEGHDSK